MDGMYTNDSLEDIAKRCGLSVDTIRRVQKAETDHVIDQLKRGKRVNLPGRGTYRIEFKNKLVVGGKIIKVLKPTFTVSSVISGELEKCTGFIQDDKKDSSDELPEGILTFQIPSLT